MATIEPIWKWIFAWFEQEEIKKLEEYVGATSEEIQQRADEDAALKKLIIEARNAPTQAAYEKYLEDIKKVKEEYETTVGKRREEREQIFKEAEQAAGFESQVQAARIGDSGRYTRGQLAKISWDISNRFMNSLIKAKTDKLEFNKDLDEKLKQLWFDVADKEKIVTALQKILAEEEAQPALDAIAAKAKTNEEFKKILSEFYSGLRKDQILKLGERREEESRYIYDAEAYAKKTPEEKRNWLRSKLAYVITDVEMTQEQKDQFIEEALEKDPYEVNALLNSMKIKNNLLKETWATTMAHSAPGTALYDSLANLLGVKTTTQTEIEKEDIQEEREEEKEEQEEQEKEEQKEEAEEKEGDLWVAEFTRTWDILVLTPKDTAGYEKFVSIAMRDYVAPDTKRADIVKTFNSQFNERYNELKTTNPETYAYYRYNFIRGLVSKGYISRRTVFDYGQDDAPVTKVYKY